MEENTKRVSLAVALAVVVVLVLAATLVYFLPLGSNTATLPPPQEVTSTGLGLQTVTTGQNGVPSQVVQASGCLAPQGVDEEEALNLVLNSSQVRQYTGDAFAFNWVYDSGQSCTSTQPATVEVNVTGLQTVSGNWSSQYMITYANNTLLKAEVSPSYQILNFTVMKAPDRSQEVVFTPQEKQVIGFALSSPAVRNMTSDGDYFVGYLSGPIGSGNQTFAGDYYLVMEQVNGSLAVGVYVNSSLTGVVGVYQLHFCRLFEANGNVCASS